MSEPSPLCPTSERAREALRVAMEVEDPELPMVTIGDLGMVRGASDAPDGGVVVDVAPTYSGCPATEVIHAEVEAAVRAAGLTPVTVRMVRTPAWSTDWITDRGRRRLEEAGIAPPAPRRPTLVGIGAGPQDLFAPPETVACPRCRSEHTELVSPHGSTPCKAMRRCLDCREPFEHFKCH